MRVEKKHVLEYEPRCFQTDASDLGLRPGEWPLVLEVSTDIGNGRSFIEPAIIRNPDGDVAYVVYRQQFGCISLKIWND